MSDIKNKQKELVLNLSSEMNWESGLADCPGVDAAFMTEEPPEYVKERLEKLLVEYIDDDNNYIVEGARVKCDQMSKKPVQMYYRNGKLGIEGEGGFAEIEYEMPEGGISLPCFEIDINNKEIGSFHVTHLGQMANDLRFATISDRSCLRERADKLKEKRENSGEDGRDIASLTSMGNCKIMRPSDVSKINKEDAQMYGTCYCLMQPGPQWINPYCMESIVENCDTKENNRSELLNQFAAGVNAIMDGKKCYHTSHHKTMKWNVEEGGEEEGLTRLSTLLCLRGGIITFTDSGQSIQNNYEVKYTGAIGANVNVKEELLKLLEMENGKELVEDYLDRIKSEYPEYVTFLDLLAENESQGSGDYYADNGSHFGRYQIGWDTLKQIKFTNGDRSWTELAHSLGVYDVESFKATEVAQEVAILFALRWDYQQIVSYGDDKYIGGIVDGVEVTLSGEIAAGHLVGTGDLHRGFTEEKQWPDVVDGSGTPATSYMDQMKELDIQGILVGIE